jgi:hypothetical protein
MFRSSFLSSSLFISYLSSLIFFIPSVSAQETAGLRLITSPLPINLSVEPGSSAVAELKVKNDGSQEEKLKVSLMKFDAYGESGSPRLMDPEPADDFIKWVSFSEPSFSLGTNEWKTIKATFNVPKSASFGYYYAIVFSRANDQGTSGSNETALVGGTAILVLLDAKVPDAKRQVEMKEFSTNRSFYEFLPAIFSVKLENTGNVHVAPHGNIFITQGNKTVDTIEVNTEQGNILPDSGRVFTPVWENGFPVYHEKIEDGKVVHDEQGNVLKELTWDWKDASKFRFGKYTAKLVMVYDDGARDVSLEAEVSFWVMPWRVIGASVVILLFAFIGFKNTFLGFFRKVRGLFTKA